MLQAQRPTELRTDIRRVIKQTGWATAYAGEGLIQYQPFPAPLRGIEGQGLQKTDSGFGTVLTLIECRATTFDIALNTPIGEHLVKQQVRRS